MSPGNPHHQDTLAADVWELRRAVEHAAACNAVLNERLKAMQERGYASSPLIERSEHVRLSLGLASLHSSRL